MIQEAARAQLSRYQQFSIDYHQNVGVSASDITTQLKTARKDFGCKVSESVQLHYDPEGRGYDVDPNQQEIIVVLDLTTTMRSTWNLPFGSKSVFGSVADQAECFSNDLSILVRGEVDIDGNFTKSASDIRGETKIPTRSYMAISRTSISKGRVTTAFIKTKRWIQVCSPSNRKVGATSTKGKL